MNVSLRQIRAFTAIAKAENFKAAVRQLRISQSALRVLMKDLEEDLSGRLLDRTTRKVRFLRWTRLSCRLCSG